MMIAMLMWPLKNLVFVLKKFLPSSLQQHTFAVIVISLIACEILGMAIAYIMQFLRLNRLSACLKAPS